MKKLIAILFATALTGSLFASGGAEPAKKNDPGEVTVYTSRHYDSDKAVFDAFTKETGIKVNVVQNKDVNALLHRIELEGKGTPADVFITVGIGDLYQAKEKGLLQPFASAVTKKNVPAKFSDKDNYYTGLTYRARILVYNPQKTSVTALSTYEDLANPKWKGKVLTRSSTSSYNRHLIAFLEAKNGKEKTEAWVKGLVKNLARTPKGNDRDQAKAVLAGEGEVAIMNSYYMGLMSVSTDPVQQEVYKTLKVFFPNQNDGGVHINVSGAGITKDAKNVENAKKLVEFLTGPVAQNIYTSKNYEFPVNKSVKMPELLESWGEIKTSDIDFDKIGKNMADAQKIADEAGFK